MLRMMTVAVFAALPVSVLAAAESYTVDPAHTFPNFTINHMHSSTMHGRFDNTTGKLTIDRDNKTGSVDIVIDANSIDTGFKRRDDDLRGPDFLNVAEFPQITYKSTKVVINADNSAVVDGDLTIAGVTKPVRLQVSHMNCAERNMGRKLFVCGFDADTQIKRSDFGVKAFLPAIGDDMNISIELEAARD